MVCLTLKKEKNKHENSINTKNYTESKKIVENYLNGTVKHKQIQVKKNYRGKFFKYKVLNAKDCLDLIGFLKNVFCKIPNLI